MKKLLLCAIMALTLGAFTACENAMDVDSQTYEVTVQLNCDEYSDVDFTGVVVSAQSSSFSNEGSSNASGLSTLNLTAGNYTIKTTATISHNARLLTLSGSTSVSVVENWDSEQVITLELSSVTTSQLVISEYSAMGCVDATDETKTYTYGRYFLVYNNSDEEVSLDNIGFAALFHWNSHGGKSINFYDNGVLSFANDTWVPASHGVYYFQDGHTIPARSSISIATAGAIDHTLVQPNSVDLSNVDYVFYDPESGYNHALTHPAPSENITSDRYLKAVRYGLGAAMASMSDYGPGFCMFRTEGMTVADFANDATLAILPPGQSNDVYACRMLPKAWLLDSFEIFSNVSIENALKRFSDDVDPGYITVTYGAGLSIYRNVNEEATKAIEGNEAKLVYGYTSGTEGDEYGSTDKSGIDAEASIKNGAVIVFSDFNDSSIDFHRRVKPTLKN